MSMLTYTKIGGIIELSFESRPLEGMSTVRLLYIVPSGTQCFPGSVSSWWNSVFSQHQVSASASQSCSDDLWQIVGTGPRWPSCLCDRPELMMAPFDSIPIRSSCTTCFHVD